MKNTLDISTKILEDNKNPTTITLSEVKNSIELETITNARTATMKIVGDETKLRLFTLFDQFTSTCSDVKEKIYNLRENEATKPIYDDYVGMYQRGRACTTTIFTTLPTEREYKGKNSFPSKYRSFGIFPLYKAPLEGYNFSTSQYHYSANSAVHTQLDSLNECDKLCNNEYNALKKEVENFDDRLRDEDAGYPNELVDNFYTFINQTMLLGWSYDENFRRFFEQVMLPELRKGVTIYRGNYKLGEKNKRYSFYTENVANEIANHTELWDIMSDEYAVKYFNSVRLLTRKKEHAQKTTTTLMKAAVRPILANNGVPFSISVINEYAYILIKLPSLNGQKPESINIKCSFHKVNDGKLRKSCYMDNLTITSNGKGKYICNYSINNKHPQQAELNECFMRLKIRNHQWFAKYIDGKLTPGDGILKAYYFDLYIDLSLNVTEEPIHNLTKNEVFGKNSIRSFYSTAYPEIKDLGNQLTITEEYKCPIDKPHCLMGIDLGQRNPFAYCVKDSNGIIIAKGHLDGATGDTYKKYINFGKDCEKVIQLIKETKSYLYGDDEAIDKDNFIVINIGQSYEDYIAYLNTQRVLVNKENQSLNRTHLMRSDKNWIIKECVWKLNCQYHTINKSRLTDSDWRQTLYWINAIYMFIDLQKSFHNFGSYYDHKNGCKVNGTGKGFCSSHMDHINNLNNDTIKKFINALLPIIKQYGVCLIALEELEAMYGDKLKNADENKMYNRWPVGKLKKNLESVVTPYNVAVIQVSERDTSQIIDGKWAERDKDILKNNSKTVHADEQAAENIVDRALTHHTNLYSMYAVNPLDNYWVANYIWSPKETGGKRFRGFLTKLYGSSNVVLIKEDDKYIKSNMSVKELKKMIKKKKLAKGEYLYRVNNNEWIDGESKEALMREVRW